MKPILVLQNLTPDTPAYFATWLREQGCRFDVFDAQAGQAYPAQIDAYGGLALLGGEMSANDDLPHLRDAERLVLAAMAAGIPVIGHCLGGQLMARALGAPVTASPQPEIGWQTVKFDAVPEAAHWFGHDRDATVFHWHSESFALPPGATRIAHNAACPNQAFALGRHLAMQFHVELDATKLHTWAASTDPSFLRLQRECNTVQGGASMLAQASEALPAQQALAARLYRRWLDGVSR